MLWGRCTLIFFLGDTLILRSGFGGRNRTWIDLGFIPYFDGILHLVGFIEFIVIILRFWVWLFVWLFVYHTYFIYYGLLQPQVDSYNQERAFDSAIV